MSPPTKGNTPVLTGGLVAENLRTDVDGELPASGGVVGLKQADGDIGCGITIVGM